MSDFHNSGISMYEIISIKLKILIFPNGSTLIYIRIT